MVVGIKWELRNHLRGIYRIGECSYNKLVAEKSRPPDAIFLSCYVDAGAWSAVADGYLRYEGNVDGVV